MATTFLNLSTWATNQNSPWTTINTSLNAIDGAIAGKVDISLTTDANYTLSNTGTEPFEWKNKFINLSSTVAITSGTDIYLPSAASGAAMLFVVYNGVTTGSIDFGLSGNTLATVANGQRNLIFFDGTNAYNVVSNIT